MRDNNNNNNNIFNNIYANKKRSDAEITSGSKEDDPLPDTVKERRQRIRGTS